MSLKIFDFQAVHFGPFGCDLHNFISQTCDSKTRTQNLTKYMTAYSNSVIETCKTLGLSDEECKAFNLDTVMQVLYY